MPSRGHAIEDVCGATAHARNEDAPDGGVARGEELRAFREPSTVRAGEHGADRDVEPGGTRGRQRGDGGDEASFDTGVIVVRRRDAAVDG